MPKCPKCGATMTGGAPHGPWPIQYECRFCGTIITLPSSLWMMAEKCSEATQNLNLFVGFATEEKHPNENYHAN